jgi:hypothetical protein
MVVMAVDECSGGLSIKTEMRIRCGDHASEPGERWGGCSDVPAGRLTYQWNRHSQAAGRN